MNEPDINGAIDLVNRYNALRQELAAVTAERDALKAKWDALELRVEQLAALPAEFASAKADNLALTQRNAALMSVLWSIEDWLDWHTDDMRASGLLAQVRDALRNNK